MNRLIRLREFLKSDPELREHSTQGGFARLLGYSTSLIRQMEQKSRPPSLRFALAAQRNLGVDQNWLMGTDDNSSPEPIDSNGAPLTAAAVKYHLRRSEGTYVEEPTHVERLKLDALAGSVVNAVKRAVLEDARHRDFTLVQRLLDLLDERDEWLERRSDSPHDHELRSSLKDSTSQVSLSDKVPAS